MNLWIFFEWLLILGNVGTAECETEHFQVHAGQLRDGTPIVVKVSAHLPDVAARLLNHAGS